MKSRTKTTALIAGLVAAGFTSLSMGQEGPTAQAQLDHQFRERARIRHNEIKQELQRRLTAQAANPSRALEIANACTKANVKFRCVSQQADGTYRVDCEQDQAAAAAAVVQEVLASPPVGQTPVETFEDAVAVIQFEPRNRQARAILRKRYDALRQRHTEATKQGK